MHKLSIVLMHHIITNATCACIFDHTTNDGFTAKKVPDFDRYKRKILTSQLQPLPSTSSAPIVQPLDIKTLFANRFAAQTIVKRVLPPGKYYDAEIQQPPKVYAHLHSNRTIILLCDYPMKELQNVLKAINRPNGILKHKGNHGKDKQTFRKSTKSYNTTVKYYTSMDGFPLTFRDLQAFIKKIYESREIAIAEYEEELMIVFETIVGEPNHVNNLADILRSLTTDGQPIDFRQSMQNALVIRYLFIFILPKK